tara:strand:- start:1731 stop:4154 length:2424 start_codon:yes stop_codon:yes gene_type:complete
MWGKAVPLKFIIPLVLFSALFASTTVFSLFSYISAVEEELSRARNELLTSGNLLSANIEAGVRYQQVGIIRSAIEQSQSDKLIVLSLLINDRGRIFSSTSKKLEGLFLDEIPDSKLARAIKQNNHAFLLDVLPHEPYKLIYQIALSKQSQEHEVAALVDKLVLVADVRDRVSEARKQILKVALIWLSISLVSSFILWLLMLRTVIKPINFLVSLSESIAKSSSRPATSPHYVSKEFSLLDNALRDMASSLLIAQDNYRQLYESNPATFLTIDASGNITNINLYGLSELAMSRDEIIGMHAANLYFEEDQLAFEQHLAETFNSKNTEKHWQLRLKPRNSMFKWVRDVARRVEIDGIPYVLIVSQDVSDLYKLSNRLSYQASHDELTGLINRSEFARLVEAAIEKSQTHDQEHCVCFLDLDQFKIINDTCGHTAGDELLKQISSILQNAVRKDDMLARVGGDEFSLLLESCKPKEAIEVIANVRKAITENRFSWKDKFFDIGISAGISVISSEVKSLQEVLTEADSACYTAKNLGRNRTILFDDDSRAAKNTLSEMNWVSQINQSLENPNGFVLFLQKITSLQSSNSNTFKGEVLIRMQDKDGNIIPPGAFLPSAERYNLAHKIDSWVVENTLKTLKQHKAKLSGQWLISLNLSAQTISSSPSNKEILSILDEHQDFKQHICFEITETVAMANYATATKFMNELRDRGFLLSLDDFGSGFSSFGYLKKMPVDFVKIDGMFIRNLANDKIDQAMVSSMNTIAHAIGKQTIAEFVEDETSLKVLKELNVDFAQGYYFHKPEPLNHVLLTLE